MSKDLIDLVIEKQENELDQSRLLLIDLHERAIRICNDTINDLKEGHPTTSLADTDIVNKIIKTHAEMRLTRRVLTFLKAIKESRRNKEENS